MSSTRDVPILVSVRIAFVFGIVCALGVIAYGRLLIPATNSLSVAAAASAVTLYAIIGWFGLTRNGYYSSAIKSVSVPLGLLAGAVFAAEVVLEYFLLPADNSRMGLVEFGVVLLIYTVAGAFAAIRYQSARIGTIAAAGTAVISSLIWLIAVLSTFYWFYGSPRQELVFRAEGNYEDFVRSGMTDFSTFVMEDVFGAGFYHLLLGPMIAATLGAFAGYISLTLRGVRHS